MRLNKYLVETGQVASRRRADTIIANGEVMINDKVAQIGQSVSEDDKVTLLGKPVTLRSHITIVMYKPKNYICSHVRQGDTPTIFSLLPPTFSQLKIAGRLDKESEGLLILSSDGVLVQHLTHPSHTIKKQYIVEVDKNITAEDMRLLLKGVRLEDGVSSFDKIAKLASTRLKVTLHTGKNRQIRRSFAVLGYTVSRLIRIAEGQLTLGALQPGEYRFVNMSELGV